MKSVCWHKANERFFRYRNEIRVNSIFFFTCHEIGIPFVAGVCYPMFDVKKSSDQIKKRIYDAGQTQN